MNGEMTDALASIKTDWGEATAKSNSRTHRTNGLLESLIATAKLAESCNDKVCDLNSRLLGNLVVDQPEDSNKSPHPSSVIDQLQEQIDILHQTLTNMEKEINFLQTL